MFEHQSSEMALSAAKDIKCSSTIDPNGTHISEGQTNVRASTIRMAPSAAWRSKSCQNKGMHLRPSLPLMTSLMPTMRRGSGISGTTNSWPCDMGATLSATRAMP